MCCTAYTWHKMKIDKLRNKIREGRGEGESLFLVFLKEVLLYFKF